MADKPEGKESIDIGAVRRAGQRNGGTAAPGPGGADLERLSQNMNGAAGPVAESHAPESYFGDFQQEIERRIRATIPDLTPAIVKGVPGYDGLYIDNGCYSRVLRERRIDSEGASEADKARPLRLCLTTMFQPSHLSADPGEALKYDPEKASQLEGIYPVGLREEGSDSGSRFRDDDIRDQIKTNARWVPHSSLLYAISGTYRREDDEEYSLKVYTNGEVGYTIAQQPDDKWVVNFRPGIHADTDTIGDFVVTDKTDSGRPVFGLARPLSSSGEDNGAASKLEFDDFESAEQALLTDWNMRALFIFRGQNTVAQSHDGIQNQKTTWLMRARSALDQLPSGIQEFAASAAGPLIVGGVSSGLAAMSGIGAGVAVLGWGAIAAGGVYYGVDVAVNKFAGEGIARASGRYLKKQLVRAASLVTQENPDTTMAALKERNSRLEAQLARTSDDNQVGTICEESAEADRRWTHKADPQYMFMLDDEDRPRREWDYLGAEESGFIPWDGQGIKTIETREELDQVLAERYVLDILSGPLGGVVDHYAPGLFKVGYPNGMEIVYDENSRTAYAAYLPESDLTQLFEDPEAYESVPETAREVLKDVPAIPEALKARLGDKQIFKVACTHDEGVVSSAISHEQFAIETENKIMTRILQPVSPKAPEATGAAEKMEERPEKDHEAARQDQPTFSDADAGRLAQLTNWMGRMLKLHRSKPVSSPATQPETEVAAKSEGAAKSPLIQSFDGVSWGRPQDLAKAFRNAAPLRGGGHVPLKCYATPDR